MSSFKRIREEKLSDRESFYSSVNDGTTGNNVEKVDGHINDGEYLTCKKVLKNLT